MVGLLLDAEGERVADVDEVVGDDAKADPALDAGKGLLRVGMATRLTPRAWAAASLR